MGVVPFHQSLSFCRLNICETSSVIREPARASPRGGARDDDSVIVEANDMVAGEITPTPQPRGAGGQRGSRQAKADPTKTTHVQTPELRRGQILRTVLGILALIVIGVGLLLAIGLTGPDLSSGAPK